MLNQQQLLTLFYFKPLPN